MNALPNDIEGNQIRKLRKTIGFSLRNLAAALGLKSKTIITLYENGKRKPSPTSAFLLVELAKKHGYQVSLEKILKGE